MIYKINGKFYCFFIFFISLSSVIMPMNKNFNQILENFETRLNQSFKQEDVKSAISQIRKLQAMYPVYSFPWSDLNALAFKFQCKLQKIAAPKSLSHSKSSCIPVISQKQQNAMQIAAQIALLETQLKKINITSTEVAAIRGKVEVLKKTNNSCLATNDTLQSAVKKLQWNCFTTYGKTLNLEKIKQALPPKCPTSSGKTTKKKFDYSKLTIDSKEPYCECIICKEYTSSKHIDFINGTITMLEKTQEEIEQEKQGAESESNEEKTG